MLLSILHLEDQILVKFNKVYFCIFVASLSVMPTFHVICQNAVQQCMCSDINANSGNLIFAEITFFLAGTLYS